jgi:secondary thiamine-phosphate synthase enzyme
MRHASDYLEFETPDRRDYVNITPDVEEFVRRSGIREGLVLVNPMHITAAVYVNDDEAGLIEDIDDWLEGLAPHAPTDRYWHNNGEDNADAHLKRQLPPGRAPDHRGPPRSRPVGAGLLRRVRRPAAQARRAQGDRRVRRSRARRAGARA